MMIPLLLNYILNYIKRETTGRGIRTLYFARHGESEANTGIANQPDHEIILTATGQSQAQQLVERLDIRPAAVYTSELLRTQQTAAYFCHKHCSGQYAQTSEKTPYF